MDLPHVYFGLIILFDHVILFKHEHSSDFFSAARQLVTTSALFSLIIMM